jgi:hypothetical protein
VFHFGISNSQNRNAISWHRYYFSELTIKYRISIPEWAIPELRFPKLLFLITNRVVSIQFEQD